MSTTTSQQFLPDASQWRILSFFRLARGKGTIIDLIWWLPKVPQDFEFTYLQYKPVMHAYLSTNLWAGNKEMAQRRWTYLLLYVPFLSFLDFSAYWQHRVLSSGYAKVLASWHRCNSPQCFPTPDDILCYVHASSMRISCSKAFLNNPASYVGHTFQQAAVQMQQLCWVTPYGGMCKLQ